MKNEILYKRRVEKKRANNDTIMEEITMEREVESNIYNSQAVEKSPLIISPSPLVAVE